jgi:DNA-3-methyladenine glycosylase
MILNRDLYERDTLIVAKELLGKFLVRETAQGITVGKIVETEAYIGPEDKASHTYNNLRTKRTKVQFGAKGYAYIYQIYGMYFCFDVTSGRSLGKPEAILVRALEPINGVEIMIKRRGVSRNRIINLTNGPSRLCMAMGITKKQNGTDLCTPPLYIDTGVAVEGRRIMQTNRVNVDYAEEWRHLPWRFFVRNNDFVSKPS